VSIYAGNDDELSRPSRESAEVATSVDWIGVAIVVGLGLALIAVGWALECVR
jgi:hypothetical protein